MRAARLHAYGPPRNLIIEDDLARTKSRHSLMTHTTNPLISVATVSSAISTYDKAIRSGEGDSLFSVNRYQTRFYRADGSAINHDPGNLIRTQDLEPWFEENSCLYLFSRTSFSGTGARIGRRPRQPPDRMPAPVSNARRIDRPRGKRLDSVPARAFDCRVPSLWPWRRAPARDRDQNWRRTFSGLGSCECAAT